MHDKDSAARPGGPGLLTAGIAIAIAIAAGTYLMLRENRAPTDEELSALVKPAPAPEAPATEAVAPPAVGTDEEQADEVRPEPSQTATQIAEPSVAPADEPAPEDTDAAGDAPAPSIDEVRLEADGVAVIAGRAAPGARVEVLVDGDVVATAQADGSGAFAAVGVVSPSEQARVLSLRAERDGVGMVSLDEVILAPLPAQPEPPAEQVASATDDGVATEGAATAQAEDGAAREGEIAAAGPAVTPSTATEASEPAATIADAPAVTAQRQAGASETPDTPNTNSLLPAPETVAEAPQSPQADPAPALAVPQIALLKSDEEGVSLLQSAPEPPGRILLDTIGYSDSGVVELAGRASSEAVEVRVYLDNRVVTTLPVETAGTWRGEVPDVDTGVYTLRVDELDAEGRVTSRLETPFKRESPDVLAAATEATDGSVKAVTVQAGDTLWAIARERYGEGVLYVRVFEANRSAIRDPDLIYPGQVFDLPAD